MKTFLRKAKREWEIVNFTLGDDSKTSISLATRNALVYFLLFLIGITVSNVLFLSYSSIEIHDLTDKRLKHTQEMIQLKFESYLNQIEDDVNQLSRSPLLQAYLENNDTTNLYMLHDEYASFLASKSTYFQIRLLATNTEGKELLRVERINEDIKRCPENELQYKGERDYFKELLQLPLDSIYYSRIDLNKENGIVSSTKTPTLRLGKKVKTLSGADCFLIANIDLRTGEAVMCQAGHPHPVIQRADGSCESIGTGGMPVGLIDAAYYTDFTAKLSSGDRIIIPSDGVMECPDPEENLLDDEGVRAFMEANAELKGEKLLEAMIWYLTEYSGEKDFPDDVSAVLLEFSGNDT